MAKPDDAFSMLGLLIGLPNVCVPSVERVGEVLEIHLETAEPNRFCKVCGMAGVVKDLPLSRYGDLPFGGKQAVLVWQTTGASNGPTEGLNSIIKNIKRVAAGFTNFAHYRTRILLAIGGCNWNLIALQPR